MIESEDERNIEQKLKQQQKGSWNLDYLDK